MLGMLINQVPTAHFLGLFSLRLEFSPPWPSLAYVIQIMLNRLGRRLAGDMVNGLTGGKT